MNPRPEPRYIVNYIAPAEDWQDEHAYIPPVVGNGIELPSGQRYRIVDVWTIHEKHGVMGYGVHAFLEPVKREDDRPANTYPAYYGA
ncbi:hypothetical protein [Aeromicrobium sp. CTD01-1L150]|uniref:hypothetical protein n=1 Tax=Aeromicrobium sp. CTD01-1L150 TaxID=3341830 RepID=UPI0035C00A1B